MKTFKTIIVISLILVFLGSAAFADEKIGMEKLDENKGKVLLMKLWGYMKARNIKALEDMMPPCFQSVHRDGARNREQELKILKNLNLGEYKITNIKSTSQGPVIIVTYFVSVSETIEGKKLDKKPAQRMTAFLKTDKGWKWILHANLRAMK